MSSVASSGPTHDDPPIGRGEEASFEEAASPLRAGHSAGVAVARHRLIHSSPQFAEPWIVLTAPFAASGEPDIPTTPALGPDHLVKPAPGRLVLFPFYLRHGTIPFSGVEPRLSAAFDVVRAGAPC